MKTLSKTLSWQLVAKLDALCDASDAFLAFLRTVRPENFCHEDNRRAIQDLAEVLDINTLSIDLAEFRSYVYLRVYARHYREAENPGQFFVVTSKLLGLSISMLEEYVCRRADEAEADNMGSDGADPLCQDATREDLESHEAQLARWRASQLETL